MERKYFLDNIRWVTVLLVLFYHVIYFYNAKGVFGGIGGFYEDQPWDAIMSLLYPWFMMLLFLVAGISSRYALSSLSHKEFIKSRTRKLLVPATIGLFVFQWMVGYFNTRVAAISQGTNPFAELPGDMPIGIQNVIKYFAYSLSGVGPLWFVQDLWLFSLLLVLIRLIEKDRLYERIGKYFQGDNLFKSFALFIVCFLLIWGGAQCTFSHPDPNSLQGLWNLYRPLAYLVPFLLGYFVFSHDAVQARYERSRFPSLVFAAISGALFTMMMYGKNDTDPIVLKSFLCNIFAWFAILAMLGCFRAWANKTNPFATYMTKSSYGVYVLHYLVIGSFGYMMKIHTTLAPWLQYVILFVAVMTIPFLLNETIKRIPFIRWCVLGMKSSSLSTGK